jgi:hypothetical protein
MAAIGTRDAQDIYNALTDALLELRDGAVTESQESIAYAIRKLTATSGVTNEAVEQVLSQYTSRRSQPRNND